MADDSIQAPVSVSPPQNTLSALDLLPQPSYRVRKGVVFFRIGFGLFVLLSGLLALVSCSASQPKLNWQTGEGVIQDQAMFQMVLDNVSKKTTASEAQQITEELEVALLGRDKEKDLSLFLVRFNTSRLCGRLGCLHTIVEQGPDRSLTNQVWSQYLHTEVPGMSALSVVPSPNGAVSPSAFACLQTSQLNHHQLSHTTYCHDGRDYQMVDQHQSTL